VAIGVHKKVVILGGGVAGMSAAHELIERGFDVEVYERNAAGGKARSMAATIATGLSPFGPNGMKAPIRSEGRALPGEHGFRFFPGFYKHVVDTMARIPYKGGTVAQNLVDTIELRMASYDRPSYTVPAEFARTTDDIKIDVFAVLAALSGQIGVGLDDGLFFATKMWKFLTSCEERRLVEYERTNWWDFIEADSRSAAYQKYFGNGITRSLVAAKARRASTKTIGDIFMQIVFEMLLPGVAADRVLNGPTNDVWINPWLEYLRARGVVYHLNSEVRAIHYERGIVRSAAIAVAGRIQEVAGDYFIGALPVERMAELVSPSLLKGDPSLANLNELTDYVEWMNGIQFYLTEDIRIAKGHAIYVDTPWALTSVSQPQFWKDFDLTNYGDGNVKGLLSVDISDWDVKGLNGKEAQHCSRQEIALETWAQLKKSLNVGGEVLRDSQLHSWFLDPDIQDPEAGTVPSGRRNNTDSEPLLVNYVDTWRLRPEAVTRIPNFFLASDYVRTFTDLATMEAANEAARRAVNGILRATQSDAEPCEIWNLHEPEVFLPFRAYDRVRYRMGLPWDGEAMAFATSVLNLATSAAALSTREPSGSSAQILLDGVQRIMGASPDLVALVGQSPGPFGNDPATTAAPPSSTPVVEQVTVAEQARASCDGGLRRLRIIQ
jgi:uncharacterized protein with NAD-binding domain and iron-sulfur cluster